MSYEHPLNAIRREQREADEKRIRAIQEFHDEKKRRHDEMVEVNKELVKLSGKQVDSLEKQIEILTDMLKVSENANEQRDAVIRFTVQIMMQMETSKMEKEKTLSSILIQISSFAALGADLSGIYDFVQKQIEELSKED